MLFKLSDESFSPRINLAAAICIETYHMAHKPHFVCITVAHDISNWVAAEHVEVSRKQVSVFNTHPNFEKLWAWVEANTL